MKMKYKYLLLVVWMLVIFLLSSEVSGTSNGRSDAIVQILTDSFHVNLGEEILRFLTRKAAHIIAYFILGILMYSIVKEYTVSVRRTLLLSVLFVLAYAVFDEIHQLFVIGRSGEVRDVLIDTIAGSVGVSAHHLLCKRKKQQVTLKP